jgi:hypothetical protein
MESSTFFQYGCGWRFDDREKKCVRRQEEQEEKDEGKKVGGGESRTA